MSFDLLLKNGTAVTPSGTHLADIAVKDGRIAGIGDYDSSHTSEVFDCTGLHILPGVIDTQVHFREPGATHKETFATGTRAAAAGGVCAVFEMPNTNPLTTTPEALDDKMHRAATEAWTEYAFYRGGTTANARQLSDWETMPGVCGIKILMAATTGDRLSAGDEEIEAILLNGRRIVAVHAEDENIMLERKKSILGDSHDVKLHPKWRSAESCLSATSRLLKLALKTGRRVHVLHVSTAEEMELLKQNRDIASVEVLINHLTLQAPECYEELGTLSQQNPPVREKEHQDALWQALRDGAVDILATDHAPHTLEEKKKEYPGSPSGMPGVQTLVPIMLDHVNNNRLTLERFVDLTAYGPARIHQIAGKGRIAAGYDADFTIVDLKAEYVITNDQQKSLSGWTPYDGKKVKGWPIGTVIRGHIVMRDNDLLASPSGKPVRFRETL